MFSKLELGYRPLLLLILVGHCTCLDLVSGFTIIFCNEMTNQDILHMYLSQSINGKENTLYLGKAKTCRFLVLCLGGDYTHPLKC